MRFLLSIPLPLLLILISFVSFDVQAAPFDLLEQWPAIRRLNRRSATDHVSHAAGTESTSPSPADYSGMSENQLKSELDKAEADLKNIQGDLDNKKKELAGQETENAAPQKDYEEKKEKWDKLKKIYDEMKEGQRLLQVANEEFELAEKNLNETISALNTTTTELQTLQKQLSEAIAFRDKVKNMPQRKPVAEGEQNRLNGLKPGLETRESSTRVIKEQKYGEVDRLTNSIKTQSDDMEARNCKANPTTECTNIERTIQRFNLDLPNAKSESKQAESDWKEAKKNLDECTTTLADLKKELDEIAEILPAHTEELNAADVLAKKLGRREDTLKKKVGTAEHDKDEAQKELTRKEEAKVKAEEAAAIDPVVLETAKEDASKAQLLYEVAETVWNANLEKIKKLEKQIAFLEENRKQVQGRIGPLEETYKKKSAGKSPGLGAMTIFGIVVAALTLFSAIVAIVWIVMKRRKAGKEADNVGKDSTVPKGGTAVSQTPASASQPPAESQKPPIDQPVSPQQPTPQASDSKEQVAVAQADAPYVARKIDFVVKVDNMPTLSQQEREDKAKIEAKCIAGTLVHKFKGTQVYNTEHPEGKNKRLLNNHDSKGFCQDGRKFDHVYMNSKTGEMKGPSVISEKQNPTPGKPHFDATCNKFLHVQDMVRPSKEERAFHRETAKTSQARRHKQLNALWQAYHNRPRLGPNKQRTRAGAERVITRRQRIKQREARIKLVQNWAKVHYVHPTYRQRAWRYAKYFFHEYIWATDQNKEYIHWRSPEDRPADDDDIRNFDQVVPDNQASVGSEETSSGLEGTSSGAEETSSVVDETSSGAEETSSVVDETSSGRENAGGGDQDDQKSRGSDQSRSKKSDRPEQRGRGRNNKHRKTKKRKHKSDRSRSSSSSRSDGSTKGDPKKASQMTDEERRLAQMPGFDHLNNRIVLENNAKECPNLARLTNDSQGQPRKKPTDEKLKNICDEIIKTFSQGKRTDKVQFLIDDLLDIINASMEIFKEEPKLIKLDSPEITAIGDVHGSVDTLRTLLEVYGKIGSEAWKKHKFVFTGDYVDRGSRSLDVITFLLALKIRFPDQIILLRGNHESYEVNIHYGFKQEMVGRFKSVQEGTDMHFYFNYLFAWMPYACLAGGTLLNHGGIPTFNLKGTLEEEINKIPPFLWEPTTNKLATALLWNDPQWKLNGSEKNGRGAGYCFGEDVLEAFLRRFPEVKLIVRAHQVVRNGYEFFGGFKMVSLFTCTNYEPDKYPNHGAILRINKDYLCYFIELVPGEEIPAELNDRDKEALMEKMKEKAADTHNMYNFISTLKGVFSIGEDPSLTGDGQPPPPEDHQC